MADNIYGDQLNPNAKNDASVPNEGQNANENVQNETVRSENASNPEINAQSRDENAANPVADNAGGQSASDGANHTFTQDGQYNIVRPQGGTTYIPPRPEAQHFNTQTGTSQNGNTFTGGPQSGGPYNPGNQQTYQRPYTTYTTGAYGYTPPPPPSPRKDKKRGVGAGALALVCVFCILLSGVAGFAGAYVASGIRSGTSGGSVISSNGDIAVLHREVITDVGEDGVATLTEVVTAVENSVVEITTEFKSMGYFQYVTSGAGSGVIISENGYIITNNHVITSDNQVADAISVRLKNGETYEATVIGTDADTDVAVIKMEGEGFTPAVFADSDQLVVGQDIVAIGNPLGELGGTVTEGIISALDREVDVDGTTMNLLQFSAAVNPGNSGGGLFNMKGQLVGIVNAKSSGEGIEGLGFAIPSNDASNIAEELMTNGYVTGKPYVGISLYYAADAYTAYRYFQSQVPGLYIAEVIEGYNDDVLEIGDRVIAVNGNEISTSDDVKNYVNECEIGDTMTFSLYRKGKLMEVEVTCYEYVPKNSEVSFN